MKKIVYLIIGIIVLSIIIITINTFSFGGITVDMMPNPMDSSELPLIGKVLTKQKGIMPIDIGVGVIFTFIYTFVLCKTKVLDVKERFTKFFIIILLIIPVFIAINIYLKYSVKIIW